MMLEGLTLEIRFLPLFDAISNRGGMIDTMRIARSW